MDCSIARTGMYESNYWLKMNHKIGLQLYSLRNQLSINFDKTLEKVACIGYEGVELAGLHGQKPEHIAELLQNLNLKLIAMHCDVLTTDGLKQSLDEAEALKCDNLICPWVAPDTFNNDKDICLFAEKLNKANQQIIARGKNLLYHNHDFEFQCLDGSCAFDFFALQLDYSIIFELDVYLARVGGSDPLKLLKTYSDRIKMMHVKDGYISPPKPNTAISEGIMNFPAIFSASSLKVEWLIVELEDCATDMFQAVRKSLEYCKSLMLM
jgi:sugar phosphate isomerase/epimerase